MRVAIADRDPETARGLQEAVQDMGFGATIFSSGTLLITHLQRDTFDLLILDWQLPDRSGSDVLHWVGNLPMPPAIIVTNDSGRKEDITAALRSGADDYVTLPEDRDVLQARIAAVLRRSGRQAPAADEILCFGRYRFRRKTLRATLEENEIPLTAKEFALALLLFQNEGRPLSRAYILDTVWKSVAGLPSRTLDMHVSRVRSKLQLGPGQGFELVTLFGHGYRLDRTDERLEPSE